MAHGAPSSADAVRSYDTECNLSAGLTVFVAALAIAASISDAREQSAQKVQAAMALMCVAHPDQTPNYPLPLAHDEQCRADNS